MAHLAGRRHFCPRLHVVICGALALSNKELCVCSVGGGFPLAVTSWKHRHETVVRRQTSAYPHLVCVSNAHSVAHRESESFSRAKTRPARQMLSEDDHLLCSIDSTVAHNQTSKKYLEISDSVRSLFGISSHGSGNAYPLSLNPRNAVGSPDLPI